MFLAVLLSIVSISSPLMSRHKIHEVRECLQRLMELKNNKLVNEVLLKRYKLFHALYRVAKTNLDSYASLEQNERHVPEI